MAEIKEIEQLHTISEDENDKPVKLLHKKVSKKKLQQRSDPQKAEVINGHKTPELVVPQVLLN